jgi:hypothetical protein
MADVEDELTRFTGVLASMQQLGTLRERLCEASRVMLAADGVVVTCANTGGTRTTVCWTQLLSRRLEALQDDTGQGPLIEALDDGEVTVADFADTDDPRWPILRERVAELHFAGTLIAIPLRSELDLRGALMVHRDETMRASDAADARFLAGTIGTAVLQDPSIGAQGHVYAEILEDPASVHEATSALTAEADIRTEDALALLRAMAFTRRESLHETARAVIDGRAGLSLPSAS